MATGTTGNPGDVFEVLFPSALVSTLPFCLFVLPPMAFVIVYSFGFGRGGHRRDPKALRLRPTRADRCPKNEKRGCPRARFISILALNKYRVNCGWHPARGPNTCPRPSRPNLKPAALPRRARLLVVKGLSLRRPRRLSERLSPSSPEFAKSSESPYRLGQRAWSPVLFSAQT